MTNPDRSHDRRENIDAWHRAVALGAVGRATDAFAALDAVAAAAAASDDHPFGSLALSTRASLMRQAGGHAQATTIDSHALALVADVADDPTHGQAGDALVHATDGIGTDPWGFAAAMDAAIGLAADHLGTGDFDTAQAYLRWAQDCSFAVLGAAPGADDDGHSNDLFCGAEPERWWTGGRTFLRWFWVSCELDLYRGAPDSAAVHREAANRWVARFPQTTPRHRIKTALISAATDAAGGATDAARAGAHACRHDARAAGLVPLEWASLCLATGLDPDDSTLCADRERLHHDLLLSGMPFQP